ncbi:Na+/H+ antiporter [Aldersonia sp. NBC_00410]|uniref:Na+/H+ antiporter n=1 Tax=Aldersonia sp. NBC_00410 TaxID=2975954 RepID=UPI0022579E92|nr:Na+/H+ antiporter [Aldersonia sp. NBC_00410]MCX5046482.1 Na+/H+ antiporter [Aldersonia sp. NBC_00410]
MDQLVLLLALMFGALIAVPLGDRLGLPSPILVTVLGVVLAALPFVPDVSLNPDYILPLVLPPLLYAAVQRTSWRQFATHWKPIVLLAVALVFATAAAVAAVAHAIVPGMTIAAAVALGALVAPPDPVAVSAVAGSLNLPRRMVSILEGEGLFNDVTAIVLYNIAIAAAVSGQYSRGTAVRDFALSAVVALAVGVAIGWFGSRMMRLLNDATLRVGMSLLVPFASYAVADHYSGSGVLAVLVTALYLAESGADADDIEGRLTGAAFWQVIDTLVTGVAFGLVGLELINVFGTAAENLGQMLGWGLAITGVVIGVRLAWLLPAAWLARHTRWDAEAEIPGSVRETVVMWWAGMRGVASVALALAIPFQVDSGAPFPDREVIIFIAFTVIMTTLVLQGMTLPWLIRILGVGADTAIERELEHELAHAASTAARERLELLAEREDVPDEVLDRLMRRTVDLGMRISPDLADEERREAAAQRLERLAAFRRIQAEMMSAARGAVLAKRNQPGVDPEVVDRVLHQLDVRSPR